MALSYLGVLTCETEQTLPGPEPPQGFYNRGTELKMASPLRAKLEAMSGVKWKILVEYKATETP